MATDETLWGSGRATRGHLGRSPSILYTFEALQPRGHMLTFIPSCYLLYRYQRPESPASLGVPMATCPLARPVGPPWPGTGGWRKKKPAFFL